MNNQVTVLNKSVLQAVVDAFKGASKDATRYALTNVLIERQDANTIRVVACDGHQLSYTDIKADNCTLTKKLCVDPLFKKSIMEVIKNFKHDDGYTHLFTFESNEHGQSFKYSFLNSNIMLESGIAESYPDYKQIIPNLDQYDYSIAINPELIIKAYEALGTNRGTGFKLCFKNKTSPMVMMNEDARKHSVIMPMRDNSANWGSKQSTEVAA